MAQTEFLSSQSGSTTGSELDLAKLQEALVPVAAKWEELARKLKLKEWQLQAIAADHPVGDDGVSKKRLSAVLRGWCSNTDGSWRDIVRALHEMDEKRLARKIEEEYCGSTSRIRPKVTARENQQQINGEFIKLKIFLCKKFQTMESKLLFFEREFEELKVTLESTLRQTQELLKKTEENSRLREIFTHHKVDTKQGREKVRQTQKEVTKEIGYDVELMKEPPDWKGKSKSQEGTRTESHEEEPPPKRARLEERYEKDSNRTHILEGFRDECFEEDQELHLQKVEEEVIMLDDNEKVEAVAEGKLEESTQDLMEAAPMKLADEKSSPYPNSPPETCPHSQPLYPQEMGYDVELVKESPDLRCPICLLVLRDPVQVNCCGKRFCRTCIQVLMTKAYPCPACKCKAGNFDIFDDKATKQNILEVRVHCSNRELGCGWKGELCQLDSHLNLDPKKGKMDLGCQYVQLKCIHCSEDCQRHHMRSCPQQPYTCPYCRHYSSTYENVSKKHLTECSEFPVQCKMCSTKVLWKSIQQHESGCGRNQDLQQSTAMPLNSHIIKTPSPVFVPPPTFIMNDVISYKEKRESWFSPPFYSHVGGYKLCVSVDAYGLGECSGTHVSVYMHLLCGEYDDSLTWPFTGSITIQLVNQRRDEGHMERTLSFSEHTPAKSTSRVAEGERGEGWGYNDFMPNSALQYNENWNTEYLRNDSIEFQISQVKLGMTAEELPVKTHTLIPPVSIVMNNFITQKICGDSWFSPPFYSHAGGYKMCLSVHANGNKSGAGTHVSVFVRVMRGEHDDNLKWPFTGDITIQLVNQGKNQEHDIVERTVNFTPSASADRVTDGERGSGIGLFQFVSHSALYCDESSSPSLLKNDCLEFRITQVKLTN